MAMRVVTESDLSGQPGASTVRFAWDDLTYELDLTAEERDQLRGVLDPYLKLARPIGAVPGDVLPTGVTVPMVREWANNNGHQVGARGRIPRDVVEQYVAAHSNGTGAAVASPTALSS